MAKKPKKSERNNNGNVHPTRLYKTPEELLEAWEAYKKSVDEQNEWIKVQYVGRDGKRVQDRLKIPYTIDGFIVHAKDYKGNIKAYIYNYEGYYDDFTEIVSYIQTEVRNNHITGGMAGVYNSALTARLNGLTDKTETKVNVEVPLFGDDD